MGEPGIDPGPADLSDIIDHAVQSITAAVATKQITANVNTTGPLVLHADAHRLQEVTDNLLGNAVKYTPAGGTADLETGMGDAGRIVWTIADTGIGIPATKRPRLFRRFYRASTALAHRIPGTGLGLVVCRTIIERHHGSITVADQNGPGTTFVITLPVKPPV